MATGARQAANKQLAFNITATDQASPVLRRVTTSLQLLAKALVFRQVGTGLEQLGTKLLTLAAASAKLASDWEIGQNRIRTQTNMTDKQFADFNKRTLDLFATLPQAASDVQGALFDIFSSTDVGYKQALGMVKLFSEAASAGGTDMVNVERAVIAEMNAFKVPASQVTHLLDLQFNMVRFGVGTYEEFASSLGDVIPSAKAAGQSLDTMSGMLAFATRNGLDTAKASISVARAIDLLYRTGNSQKLYDTLGISVIDPATGKYRQMTEVIADMGRKLSGLSDPQRAKVLAEIFGQGEIRANRFFKIAIPNFQSLLDLTKKVSNSGGALANAWDQVRKSFAIQWDVFLNHLRAIGVVIGEYIIPKFEQMMNVGDQILKWFDKLSPRTKQLIGEFLIFSGAILLVSGKIFRFTGLILGLQSMLKLADVQFISTTGAMLGMLGVITALGLGAVLIMTHWKEVGPMFMKLWSGIGDIANQAFDQIKAWWDHNGNDILRTVTNFAMAVGRLLGAAFELLARVIPPVVTAIVDFFNISFKIVTPLINIAALILHLASQLKILVPVIYLVVTAFLAWKTITTVQGWIMSFIGVLGKLKTSLIVTKTQTEAAAAVQAAYAQGSTAYKAALEAQAAANIAVGGSMLKTGLAAGSLSARVLVLRDAFISTAKAAWPVAVVLGALAAKHWLAGQAATYHAKTANWLQVNLHALNNALDDAGHILTFWTHGNDDANKSTRTYIGSLGMLPGKIEGTTHALLDSSTAVSAFTKNNLQLGVSLDTVGKKAGVNFDIVSNYLQATGQDAGKFFADMNTAIQKNQFDDWLAQTDAALQDWKNKVADSLNFVKGALSGLASQNKLTSADIIKEFSKQLVAMDNYGKNWKKVADSGIKGAKDFLQNGILPMGADGQRILQALASGNKAQMEMIIGQWDKAKGKSKELAGGITTDLIGTLKDLNTTLRQMAGLDMQINTKAAQTNLNAIYQDSIKEGFIFIKHSGGMAGDADRVGARSLRANETAIVALKDEFVVNPHATRQNRKLLEQINSGRRPSFDTLPRYHTGGLINGAGLGDAFYFGKEMDQWTYGLKHFATGVAAAVTANFKRDPAHWQPGGGPIVQAAKSALGKPYVFGASGPNAFDCSGLVYWALNKAGYHVPRMTAEGYQGYFHNSIARNSLNPGDLPLFWFPNDRGIPRGRASHIGIATGANQMINALTTGTNVKYDSIFANAYIGARRVAGQGGGQHQFSEGGWIKEPVVGVGVRSGQSYSFAEKRPEYVSPQGGGDKHYHFHNTVADISTILRDLTFMEATHGW